MVHRRYDGDNLISPWAVVRTHTPETGMDLDFRGDPTIPYTTGYSWDNSRPTAAQNIIAGLNNSIYKENATPWAWINSSLNSSEKAVAATWLDEEFGAGVWTLDNYLYHDLPNEITRVYISFHLSVNGDWNQHDSYTWVGNSYVFYNTPSPYVPKPLDRDWET